MPKPKIQAEQLYSSLPIMAEILNRDGTVEIRKRKDGIVVLEVCGRVKKTIPYGE